MKKNNWLISLSIFFVLALLFTSISTPVFAQGTAQSAPADETATSTYTLADLTGIGDIVLNGTSPSYSFYIPVPSEWQLTGMNSIEQNTASSSGGDFTLTSQKFTGAAAWTFNADNTSEFSADNFEQDFTMSTTAGGQSMDIPISLKINGKSTAAYSVDGDQISFSNQEQSGLTIDADVMGASTPLDTSLMSLLK